MSGEDYIAHIRDSRKRASVLKIKVLKLRSRDQVIPILIFEGKTDIGPYSAWINRITHNFKYEGIHGEGKGQLLDFRASTEDSDDENFQNLYYFIDNDYDGLRGHNPSFNLFCLDAYSFENYLVSKQVLRSILHDEFECSVDPDSVEATLKCFDATYAEFTQIMQEANLRFYLAAKFGLERGRVCNKLSKFVEITTEAVISIHSEEDLVDLIPLKETLDDSQITKAREEFEKLDNPQMQYRGKYIHEFFLIWLERLAEARKNGAKPFTSLENIKFTRTAMSYRSLASRSVIPANLTDYIIRLGESYH